LLPPGELDPGAPQRRLTNPGDAFQQQRQFAAPRVKEAANPLQFGMTPDDLGRGHRRHVISGAERRASKRAAIGLDLPRPIIRRMASQRRRYAAGELPDVRDRSQAPR
jgi:hypothetical protein